MSSTDPSTIWIIVLSVGIICAIIYTFYMSWFRPAKFLERNVRAGLSSYYASSAWLWLMRIASTLFLLVILFIAYNVIRSSLNGIP
jgi:hypothetical protein